MQVLQLYAAHALSRSGSAGGRDGEGGSSAAEEAVQRLLAADEESWDALLGEAARSEVRRKTLPGFQLGTAQHCVGEEATPLQLLLVTQCCKGATFRDRGETLWV